MTDQIIKEFFMRFPGPFSYQKGRGSSEGGYEICCDFAEEVVYDLFRLEQYEFCGETRAAVLVHVLNAIRPKSDLALGEESKHPSQEAQNGNKSTG